jgi:predicted nucleic acid-binding protein
MGWLPTDERDAAHSALLRTELRQIGRQLNAIDGLIAAMALRSNMLLLTTDGDFDVAPSWQRENWIAQLRT